MKIGPLAPRLLVHLFVVATLFCGGETATYGAEIGATRGSNFIIWKNGIAPVEVKVRNQPYGEWRGMRRYRRGPSAQPADSTIDATTPFVQPASYSGRVPGDGGFAGVNVKQEQPLIIDLMPWAAIAAGQTKHAVETLLGAPEVKLPLKWFYPGDGWLSFDEHGAVTEFTPPTVPVAPKPGAADSTAWRLLRPGMTKEQVQTHLGEPEIKLTYKWFYGPERWIAFDADGVAQSMGLTKA